MKNKWKQNFFYLVLKQEWAFYMDIAVYIMSVIIAQRGFYNPTLADGTKLELYLKPCWLWQVCAVAITLGWINLLVYMRQMSLFGRYIIILNDILYTFISFVVIFVIFVTSFTFGFHVLLYSEGGQFATFKDAFLKTLIMMSGEFDYGDIFYPEDAASAPYPGMTYAFFIVFFILLALILLNLLVGLSVSDVNIFVEVADLKRMSMRLKFVLNMERLLNSRIINSIRTVWEKYIKKLKFLKSEKMSSNVTKESVEHDDHSSKMWKQVIATNVQEEKKNDFEELKHKSDKIEEKLKDLEDEAKRDHNRRKKELEETISQFKESLFQDKSKDIDERKLEVDRTITFMQQLGKLLL